MWMKYLIELSIWMLKALKKENVVVKTLDCRGLYCPLPIVEMKKVMKTMDVGETVMILATDPGSERDFKSWCNKTGNRLLEASEENGVFTYLVKKA
jgi:tRNA 2-thiouridine synthesizing protein A